MKKHEMPAEVRAYFDGMIDATEDHELREMIRPVMASILPSIWDAIVETSNAAVAHEREECAKVADDGAKGRESTPEEAAANKRAQVIAAAIRARGGA